MSACTPGREGIFLTHTAAFSTSALIDAQSTENPNVINLFAALNSEGQKDIRFPFRVQDSCTVTASYTLHLIQKKVCFISRKCMLSRITLAQGKIQPLGQKTHGHLKEKRPPDGPAAVLQGLSINKIVWQLPLQDPVFNWLWLCQMSAAVHKF